MEDGRPGMFNRYSYTFNDPIGKVDPDGEVATAAIGAVVGGVIGGVVSGVSEYRSQGAGKKNWKAIIGKSAVGGAAGAATGAFIGSGAGVVAAVGANAGALNAAAGIAIDGAAGKPAPTATEALVKIGASAAMGATGINPIKNPTTVAQATVNVATNAAIDMATPGAVSAVQGIGDGVEPGVGTPSEQLDKLVNPLPDIGGEPKEDFDEWP